MTYVFPDVPDTYWLYVSGISFSIFRPDFFSTQNYTKCDILLTRTMLMKWFKDFSMDNKRVWIASSSERFCIARRLSLMKEKKSSIDICKWGEAPGQNTPVSASTGLFFLRVSVESEMTSFFSPDSVTSRKLRLCGVPRWSRPTSQDCAWIKSRNRVWGASATPNSSPRKIEHFCTGELESGSLWVGGTNSKRLNNFRKSIQ